MLANHVSEAWNLSHQNHHHVANVQVPWLVVSVSDASSLTASAQSRRERAEEVVEEEDVQLLLQVQVRAVLELETRTLPILLL